MASVASSCELPAGPSVVMRQRILIGGRVKGTLVLIPPGWEVGKDRLLACSYMLINHLPYNSHVKWITSVRKPRWENLGTSRWKGKNHSKMIVENTRTPLQVYGIGIPQRILGALTFGILWSAWTGTFLLHPSTGILLLTKEVRKYIRSIRTVRANLVDMPQLQGVAMSECVCGGGKVRWWWWVVCEVYSKKYS